MGEWGIDCQTVTSQHTNLLRLTALNGFCRGMDESRLVNLLIGSGLVVVGATAAATTRVHEEVGDGRQIQSQVLGDRLLHFSRGTLGLAEDSLKIKELRKFTKHTQQEEDSLPEEFSSECR